MGRGTARLARGWACAVAAAVAACAGGCDDSGPAGGAGSGSGGEGQAAGIQAEAVFGSIGDVTGKFAYPRAIDADARAVWVVDKSARVQGFDARTLEVGAWFRMPEWKLGKPVGLTLGPAAPGVRAAMRARGDGEGVQAHGRAGGTPGTDDEAGTGGTVLYVADTHYNRVMVYALPQLDPATAREERTARLVASWGSYGMGPGEFIYPTDVALVRDATGEVERVYVSEYGGNDRVSCFDGDLKFMFAFGSFGDGAGRIAGAGASAGGSRGAGDAEGEGGSAGEQAAGGDGVGFSRPQSVVVDESARRLIVADSRNHRLGVFGLDGEVIGWIGAGAKGSAGREGEAEFRYPYGVTLLSDATVLVAEWGVDRVQRVDVDSGRRLGTWGGRGTEVGRLSTPWATAVVGERTYVLDSGNHRVQVMRTPGGSGGRRADAANAQTPARARGGSARGEGDVDTRTGGASARHGVEGGIGRAGGRTP